MKKTINGLEYMDGTSKGSLYLVVLTHDKTGIDIGFQVGFRKMPDDPKLTGMSVYCRAQKFDASGEPVIPDLEDLHEALHRIPSLQVKSKYHMSGAIFAGVMNPAEFDTPEEAGDKIGDLLTDMVKQLSKISKTSKLKDEYIRKYAKGIYYQFVGYDPDSLVKLEQKLAPDVEDQLSSDFDFMSLLGKPASD